MYIQYSTVHNILDRDVGASTRMLRTSGDCKNDLLLTQFMFKGYKIEEKAFTYMGEKLWSKVYLRITQLGSSCILIHNYSRYTSHFLRLF